MCNRIDQKSDKLLANLHFFSDADILQMKLVSAGGVLFSRARAEYFVMENRCSRPVNVLNGALHSSLYWCASNERLGLGLQWTRTWYQTEILAGCRTLCVLVMFIE